MPRAKALSARELARLLLLPPLLVLVSVLSAACADEPPPIDRVGVGAVDKSVFEGSWYMSRTVIEVDYAGSQVGTFPGDISSDDAQNFTVLPRIRWEITEDHLFAYRDYALIDGGEPDPKGADVSDEQPLGQPIAAYPIDSHFDIQRDYSTSTGEQRNVIVENTKDRRWHEREFMRVDWSDNELPAYFGQSADLNALFGYWKREPTQIYAQEASDLPSSWSPQFHRMGCDGLQDDTETCLDHERELAGDYAKDELYHMSFVSQEVLSPSEVPDGRTGQSVNWCIADGYSSVPACTAIVSHVRTSFLKVSDTRQYEPVNWVDSRFDRFGYFRLSVNVDDRSTGDPADPAYGFTDFLNYNVHRHNIWRQWTDDDDAPVPHAERDVRPIVWYTTPELPAHLVRTSFDLVSQWNETMMETVRNLRGQPLPSYPRMDCQREDPDGYCFCQPDPVSGEIIRPTCDGHYDPFLAEPPAGSRDAYDCRIEFPDDAEPAMDRTDVSDADFNGWFSARMVGSECVNTLRVNGCNRATIAANGDTSEGLECQERGDLRYKFLSYVDQPGTGFLGIATLRGDPQTGEIIAGDANIGGPALDGFRTSALETYDLINGTVDERDIITGEDVRAYLENLGKVQLPALPRADYSVAMRTGTTTGTVGSAARAELDGAMASIADRIKDLQGVDGRSGTFSDRLASIAGTDLEQRLLAGSEGQVMAGVDQLSGGTPELTEHMLDRVSPFRNDFHAQHEALLEEEDKLSRHNVMMPNAYVDDSVQWFVNKHSDWSRARLEFGVNRLLYRQTQLHELGHCLGLRHDFGSSADSDHYHRDYYEIAERYPLPTPDEYDLDGEAALSPQEQAEFERDYAQVRAYREQAGIDGAMNSSVMEYTSNWYQRLQPIGRYDRAAIAFAYGDAVEAYAGPVAHDTDRTQFKYYQGGELCRADDDCPYSSAGSHAQLLFESNLEEGLTQRCVANPSTPSRKLCSSFDDDIVEQQRADLQPLTYRFCSDRRADATLPWCNRFDEGDSFREMVRNVTESYDRSYIFSAFRRYDRGFSIGGYQSSLMGRRLQILRNITDNLLYRITALPDLPAEEGPFGVYDQFLASIDVLNFYGRVLAQPQIGTYSYRASTESYVRTDNPDNIDLDVPLGLGRYFFSSYQRGLSGYDRIERIGSFYDKLIIMQLLTFRGLRPQYTPDLAFYTNFYDLFPVEISQMFGGMIRGNPDSYMARVVCEGGEAECDDPQVVYMDFYRGDCTIESTCRPDPTTTTYAGLPVLDGGANLQLRIYALLFSLAEFPIYYDTTFQNQMFICIEGQGDCHTPDADAVEGEDYVRYTSDRYLKSFLAYQVAPKIGVGDQTSLGFAMVKEARDLEIVERALVAVIDASGNNRYSLDNLTPELLAELATTGYEVPGSPIDIDDEFSRVRSELQNLESFFNQVIEIERSYGIRSFGYWR